MQETTPPKQFTLDIQPTGDHLMVNIPEIGVTVEVLSTNRDAAIDAGHRAISRYHREQRRREREAAAS